MIALDVDARSIDLLISEEEFANRGATLPTLTRDDPNRGYARLFQQTVTQADQGCDFDFMIAKKD